MKKPAVMFYEDEFATYMESYVDALEYVGIEVKKAGTPDGAMEIVLRDHEVLDGYIVDSIAPAGESSVLRDVDTKVGLRTGVALLAKIQAWEKAEGRKTLPAFLLTNRRGAGIQEDCVVRAVFLKVKTSPMKLAAAVKNDIVRK